MAKEKQEVAEKKFFVNIEGTQRPWDNETITVSQMRALGNLPASLPVVEEFPDGKEKTLSDSDTVLLKPGHRYGRAPKFKRG
jgi:hypothetical protein